MRPDLDEVKNVLRAVLCSAPGFPENSPRTEESAESFPENGQLFVCESYPELEYVPETDCDLVLNGRAVFGILSGSEFRAEARILCGEIENAFMNGIGLFEGTGVRVLILRTGHEGFTYKNSCFRTGCAVVFRASVK